MRTTKTTRLVPIGTILTDKKQLGMYRVLTSEITVSDLLNIDRAKDLSIRIKEKQDVTSNYV